MDALDVSALERCLTTLKHAHGRLLEAAPDSLDHDLLRRAARHGLLPTTEVNHWVTYRDNRNETAHEYGKDFAGKTVVTLPTLI